jgi:hypothetical protein
VLNIIFGPTRNVIIICWRKLHREELHKLYSSPDIIKVIKSRRRRWAGHVARIWRREMHLGSGGKTRRGETTRKKMDIREIIWGGMDSTRLVQDRDHWRALVNTVMDFGFHEILGFSRVAERLVASQEGHSSRELV